MRPELAAARRRAEVRAAARDWERAGLIGAGAREAIDARHPDDRVSKSPVWRALIFIFVWVIASSAAGVVLAVVQPSEYPGAMLAILFGAVLAAATEIEQGPGKMDGTGAEAATSFLAVTSIVVGAAVLFDQGPPAVRLGKILLLSAALWGTASWRWGFPIYALFSTIPAFFAAAVLARDVRVVWVAAAAAAMVLSTAVRRLRIGASGRSAWAMVTAAALAALYAAVNLYSLDHAWLEELRPGLSPAPPTLPGARVLAATATALFPLAVLAAGLVRRRRLLIDLGLVFSALSLVTLRAYVRLGPLWLVLAEGGAAAIVVALAAERWLDAGPGRERGGLTADALFEDARHVRAVSAAATVLALSPEARTAPAGAELKPGGGSYGGGGATGEF